MIAVGKDLSIHPAAIATANIYTTHYVNGHQARIVIQLIDGTRIERNHGYDIDVWKIKDEIDKAIA